MQTDLHETQYYWSEVQRIVKAFRGGVDRNTILEELIECFEKYSDQECRANFLFLYSEVLQDMGCKAESYEIFRNAENLFPGTLYARVSSDISKLMFVEDGGRLSPIPLYVTSVQIEPTNYCNIDCIMCSRNKNRQLGHMDFNIYKRIVDQSLAAGVMSIRLYHMGEPLLHPFIVKFVKYFKHKVRLLGFGPPLKPRSIGIQTNGTLLNAMLAKDLMEAGTDDIAFSIDGRSPEEFEKIRPRAKFSQVMENLNRTRSFRDLNGFSTRISVCILEMGLNNGDKTRLNEFYLGNGADTVFFNPCAAFPGRKMVNESGNIVPAECQLNADNKGTHHVSVANDDRSFAKNELDRMVVLWNGDIKSSCGEPSNGNIIGNIRETSMKDAYDIKMKNLGFI